jgi:predicted O-methyltransferase YrrM
MQLSPQLASYLRTVAVKEPGILSRLREETAALPDAHMQISPDQGTFFQFLIRATGARRCLEVGVFTGYSSLSVALALPEDGRITACDISPEYTAVARRYWREAGVENKIELRLGPALDTLDRLLTQGQAGTYDFAFLDADKAAYPDYWDRIVPLMRTGGVITVDNVLRAGKVADESVQDEEVRLMRQFNRKVAADGRVYSTILALRDGITLAYKL